MKFVEQCESATPPDNTAKIIMHQCQRLVGVAEGISGQNRERHALPVLFLMICAEAVAKLDDKTTRGSRKAIHALFSRRLPADRRTAIANGFRRADLAPLCWDEVVDVLYDVRCSVAHEGHYWEFNLGSGACWNLTGFDQIQTCLTIDDLVHAVVHACFNAARAHV